MDQTMTYNKTFQERLQEYNDVLGDYDNLPVSQLNRVWSFYLALTIDPCGWQAIWKLPRLTCEKLKIEFPTLVLVYVENVYFDDLSANVRILSVQDDVQLPKVHYVPLIQLWPTKEQDSTVDLNLGPTMNGIDIFRFFYINLFMPWDVEEDSSNWFNKHLESRLRLFYDLRNGTIPAESADYIKGMLTEARHLQTRLQCLLSEIDVNEEVVDPDPSTQSALVQNVLDKNVRMMQIRNEVELLKDPLFRNHLLLPAPKKLPTLVATSSENWVVYEQGKTEDFVHFLLQVKSCIGNGNIKFQSTLSMALENANADDTLFLNSSKHVLGSLGSLQKGGSIIGVSSEHNPTLSSINEDIMIDCCGEILLENLNIDVDLAQCGILVRSGTVTLKNCKITGDNKSSTHQGIIVLAGAKLNVINCNLNAFHTAIVVNSHASVNLKNSTVHNVHLGIKCYDDCNVKIESTKFENCQDFAVFFETDDVNSCTTGGFDILLNIQDVIIDNVTGKDSGKGDAKINHKRKLEPIHDLFSNPNLNPTFIHNNSDGEMEVNGSNSTLENTVICT